MTKSKYRIDYEQEKRIRQADRRESGKLPENDGTTARGGERAG